MRSWGAAGASILGAVEGAAQAATAAGVAIQVADARRRILAGRHRRGCGQAIGAGQGMTQAAGAGQGMTQGAT